MKHGKMQRTWLVKPTADSKEQERRKNERDKAFGEKRVQGLKDHEKHFSRLRNGNKHTGVTQINLPERRDDMYVMNSSMETTETTGTMMTTEDIEYVILRVVIRDSKLKSVL